MEPDVMILKKYFRRKIKQKYWHFFVKQRLIFAKIVIITLVFEKKANFFSPKIWRKSRKIVIITSTPAQDMLIIWRPKNYKK
jgi:hypothetical protein